MKKARNFSLDISSYKGIWDKTNATHLLRRTVFGPKKTEIDLAVSLGLEETLNLLVESTPKTYSAPVNYYNQNDPITPLGAEWIDLDYSVGKEFIRKNSFRAWRIGNMLNQQTSIHQKMQLFWFNHFAIESDVANDSRGMYELSELFYKDGLGNFKTLVDKVTLSQSMLIYLNGDTNQATSPNENYARELFELFTVGKGPQIEEGNYTNYTEDDIKEASKVLSGYRTRRNPRKEVYYVSNRHNKENKQFSGIYNNQIITNAEDQEYKVLIDMIFGNAETAKHICRKLYRWFVYYDITEEIEAAIITPLSETLISNNFEVKPVIRQLLSSEHFFDSNFHGVQIKSPIDYVIGIQRQLEVSFPDPAKYEPLYKLWFDGFTSAASQLQSVSDPPDVAGWKAYYQEPGYYRLWISSVTLNEREIFSNKMLGNGFTRNGEQIQIDPFLVFDQFENKSDPNEVVRQFTELLLPVALSDQQKDDLKEALIPGLPDFEWTVEYDDYADDPNDTAKENAIRAKLIDLLSSIKNLPQFQLM